MSASTMTFNQIATILNAIHNQATGSTAIAPLTTADFVNQAKAALETGVDPVMQAVSQVLSRTIFSIRPYSAKFSGLMVDGQRYGNHVRKINYGDQDFMEDDRIKLVDGASMDQQMVRVPAVLQTNIYGEEVFQKPYTIFRDQLDVAFSGPDEFQRFVAGVVQNANDMLEQARENLARALLANYIVGKTESVTASYEDTTSVIHLLTEYNAATGLTLTVQTVYQPNNFKPFMQWVYSRIAQATSLLTERTQLFHVNITGKALKRHTPYDRQRVYLYAPARYQAEAQVLADTYHDNYLRFADTGTVNFWQNPQTPDEVQAIASFLATDGTIKTSASAQTVSPVFGVILDEETLGWTPINQWQAPAPFNARGGYTTVWMHETQRHWTDMTENGIVLLLD